MNIHERPEQAREKMVRSFADRSAIGAKPEDDRRRPPRYYLDGWKDRMPKLSFQLNRPLMWRHQVKSNPTGMARNRDGKAIGPFNNANAVAENVLVETDCFQRAKIFQSIKIEMINRQPAATVLVKQREGRACYRQRAVKGLRKPFYELGFACAQIASQSKHSSCCDLLGNTRSGRFGLSEADGSEHTR